MSWEDLWRLGFEGVEAKRRGRGLGFFADFWGWNGYENYYRYDDSATVEIILLLLVTMPLGFVHSP